MKSAFLVTCLVSTFASPPAALAQAAASGLARSFVSSNGSDSNDCSRQAPCRSFASAITKTAAGGEINTLDPGGYGPVTITKAISIVSGLGEAGVLIPAGGTGITIQAGSSDQVNLRGLAIEGAGVGKTGVLFKSGGSLTISNAVVRNVTDNALDLQPTGYSYFAIVDTLVSDNGRVGVYVYPQGDGLASAFLTRVTASHNQWGVYSNGHSSRSGLGAGVTVRVVVSESAMTNNIKGDGVGILSDGLSQESNGIRYVNTEVVVDNSVVSGNLIGMLVFTSDVKLFGSRIISNLNETLKCTGGGSTPYEVDSYGNNVLSGPSVHCTVTANMPQ